MTTRRTYGTSQRRYPYPASYSYYPTRSHYNLKKKSYYPLIVVALGVLVAVYGLVSMPKVGPDLKAYADSNPDQQVAVLVFCNPCTGVEGTTVATGKKMVVDTAEAALRLPRISGVKQVMLLGKV